ncbi:MAG TPA: thiamine ABC transporter substrate-binding protein, partial [Anaerolineaceae bacterium]|nr:thiamine ABC transporter substrate-binding protein [Anaerolineaceae bacterium]
KRISFILTTAILAGLLAGCAGSAQSTPTPATEPGTSAAAPTNENAPSTGAQTLTVMTHDSFAASEPVITAFEQENNVKVSFVQSGDAGSTLNRAILSKDAPIADAFYGVDNTFLSRALDAGIFVPYKSPLLDQIPDEFKLDPENRVTPIDFGDVCINYDKAYFAGKNLAVPQSLADLTKPEYKGLLAVENPATSSPGLAFLLATIADYGEDGYLNYWQQLKDNGLVVVNDWETAYYTNFSASTGHGPQPMVVSYGSSPAVEVVFAEQPIEESPTASIVGPNTCFRQVEFAAVLAGAKNPELAQKFIDYMLSVPFQEDMPLQMYVYPVNPNAKLPEVFVKNAQIPEKPARIDPAQIAQNRDKWIQDWTDAVLR